ncbi:Metallo-dependent phosphatase-like protein [Aspergillus egyptiacus]|nr:Metallo-dependent phosphatase-like protein [Aspergillus egyptiacus]
MATSISQSGIKTRFVVLSDTHGHDIPAEFYKAHADVAIHCGDLTTESKLEEFKLAIQQLAKIDAPLKLVIAGNHDFTLDIPMFRRKVMEVKPSLNHELVKREYGDYGEVKELFDQAQESGIFLLDEGIHHFTLRNGARLRVYASPYTPSLGDWGFQYHPESGHDFVFGKERDQDVDIVMTHGPPRGIMDLTYSNGRAGCPRLFEALARARPLMHCFGHIHEGWGAKVVKWREQISERPSHFSDIDHGRSTVIGRLADLGQGTRVLESSHCRDDHAPVSAGTHTLFVNAAVEGTDEFPTHPLWQIDLELPRAS